MTATRAEAQAKIDAAVTALETATTALAAARSEIGQLVDPAPPAAPPPPSPTPGNLFFAARDSIPNPHPLTKTTPDHVARDTATFKTQLSTIRSGEWLLVEGATIPGTYTLNRPFTQPTWITFHNCKLTGTPVGSSFTHALFLNGADYLQLRFDNSTIENLGGDAITVMKGKHWSIDGLVAHNIGYHSVALFPSLGEISDFFLRMETYDFMKVLTEDKRLEPGTGGHGLNVCDRGTYPLQNGKIVEYAHDAAHGGSAIEIGAVTGYAPYNIDIWLRAENLLEDAKVQVGGNGTNLQQHSGQMKNIVFHVLEAIGLHGRAVDTNAVGEGDLSGVTVEEGYSHNCCLNPALGHTEPAISPTEPWDPRHNVAYRHIVRA